MTWLRKLFSTDPNEVVNDHYVRFDEGHKYLHTGGLQLDVKQQQLIRGLKRDIKQQQLIKDFKQANPRTKAESVHRTMHE